MPEHVPVLLAAVLDGLNLHSNDDVIDATLGGGGHAQAMLNAIAPDGRLLGLEADPRTLSATTTQLIGHGACFVPAHGNFRDLQQIATSAGFTAVAAVLFDLGVSSMTIGDAARGFSFQADGPLDMRFDPMTQSQTAAALIAESSAETLTEIFRDYGDERAAKRIAEHLKTMTPPTTTRELATAIEVVKPRRGRTHPATQVFQALRIAVNDEYGAITQALPQALELLRTDGRLAVITFHSGEDRLVKRWMKSLPTDRVTINTKHVIVPDRAEQLRNPRARSAKLRILTKR